MNARSDPLCEMQDRSSTMEGYTGGWPLTPSSFAFPFLHLLFLVLLCLLTITTILIILLLLFMTITKRVGAIAKIEANVMCLGSMLRLGSRVAALAQVFLHVPGKNKVVGERGNGRNWR